MATCKDCICYSGCSGILNDFGMRLNPAREVCDRFEDHARFVELPCKVGDTLYSNNQFIQSARVMAIYIDGNGGMFDLEITAYNDERFLGFEKFVDKDYTFEDIGVNLFLTREEAEQALKERENDEK